MSFDDAFARDHEEEIQAAMMELESAAWSRQWTRLKAARLQVQKLTGVEIKGKLRKELEHDVQQLKAKRLA